MEQTTLEQEIIQYIGQLDSLYKDRVRVHAVLEKPFAIVLNGRLAAVHDLDGVKTQIKGLLVDRYGQTKLSSSRWLVNGFIVFFSIIKSLHKWFFLTHGFVFYR